jgi:putative restriction endonuclease
VLDAYKRQCAFCRLRHAELLDAAHIVPDSEESGDPIVSNGLALCKIHHAAFDRQFIGVSPDYKIIVREDILYENDGPMLKHGIQELHNKTLLLPSNSRNWPDQERLEERFILFKNVAI